MEEQNPNTIKALTIGVIILFVGCVFWLIVSRQDIRSLNEQLDQSKLKHEAMLSEKLIQQKDLDKQIIKNETLQKNAIDLEEALKMKAEMVTTQTKENLRIKRALETVRKRRIEESESHQEKLDSTQLEIMNVQNNNNIRKDSIRYLLKEISMLSSELESAISRTIDQTLVVAHKRNKKLTSKSRKAKALTAKVALPYILSDLQFTVEGPTGSVLSDNGSLTARQVASEEYASASIKNFPLAQSQTKTMEIVYVPKETLEEGTYVFKIYNGGVYVGSMEAKLR
jgi:hypothetical protein